MGMSAIQRRDLQSFALLCIPIGILFFNPSWIDPFNISKLLLIFALSLAILLTALITRKKTLYAGINRQTFTINLLPYLLFGLTLTVAGWISTENRWRLFMGIPGRNNGLIYYFSAILLCLIILSTGDEQRNKRRIVNCLDFTGFILIAYSLVQYFRIDPFKWQGSQNSIIATFGNANFSAAALGSFAVYYFIRAIGFKKTPIKAYLYGSVSIAAIFLSIKTDSLQGPLIFLVGFMAAFALNFSRRKSNPWIKLSPIALFLIVGFITFASFLGFGPFGDKFEQYTLKLRFIYSQIGFRIMLENLLTGIGADSYIDGFRLFRSKSFIEQYGLGVVTDNAHSVPIQIGANFGVVAMTIYLFIMIRIVIRALKFFMKETGLDYEFSAISMFWILLFTQSLLSIEQIGLGITVWLLGAFILRLTFEPSDTLQNAKSTGKALRNVKISYSELLTIATVLFGLIIAIPYAREDAARRNLISLEIKEQPASGDDVNFVNENFAKLSGITLNDPILIGPILEKLFAVNQIERIGKISQDQTKENPRDFYALQNLATYYQIVKKTREQLEVYQEMIELDPMNYRLQLDAAKLSASLQLMENARSFASSVIDIAPQSDEAKEAKLILNS